jgi:hypothetical protein
VCREGERQLRLVEFTPEFVEEDWGQKGHSGMVLSGPLQVDFRGRLVFFPEGSGVFILPGKTNAHKRRSMTRVVRLILVEEVQ